MGQACLWTQLKQGTQSHLQKLDGERFAGIFTEHLDSHIGGTSYANQEMNYLKERDFL